jgi:hypothetical protein
MRNPTAPTRGRLGVGKPPTGGTRCFCWRPLNSAGPRFQGAARRSFRRVGETLTAGPSVRVSAKSRKTVQKGVSEVPRNRKVDAANKMKLVGLNIMGIFKFRIQCVRIRRPARDSSGAYRGKRSSRPDLNLTVRRQTKNR